jgi:hypothetical protein
MTELIVSRSSTKLSSPAFEERLMSLWRDNSLSIVLVTITLLTIVGMFLTGWQVFDQELGEHGRAGVSAGQYFMSGHFLSTMFENWESEFLEKAAYVVLTAFLIQRGSAESKDPDKPEEVDEDPAKKQNDAEAPWPVRSAAWIRSLYSYSLGIALTALFIATIFLHLTFSWQKANLEASLHGGPAVGYWAHLIDSQFWFESFQNWQSEFMSTGVLVILSIFLRFRGSPESKPVAAPHSKTGK